MGGTARSLNPNYDNHKSSADKGRVRIVYSVTDTNLDEMRTFIETGNYFHDPSQVV